MWNRSGNKGAYTAGLAAKKGAVYAKDSIDFLVTIKDQLDNGISKVWRFEVKGRVTAETKAEEERNLHYLNNPHVQIQDDEVSWEVANEGERFQILQHAYVYDLDTVVSYGVLMLIIHLIWKNILEKYWKH